jgi:hypothetical protein
MPKVRKQVNKRNGLRRRRRVVEGIGMPSQINTHPIATRVFRFQNGNNSGTTYITRKCLLKLFGYVYAAAATAITMIQSIRIRRVSIWGCASTGQMQTFFLEWTDPHGPSTQYTATATTTTAGHISARPPENSFASLWSQVTNTGEYNSILFQIQYIPYLTVDLEAEWVLSDGTVGNNEFIQLTAGGNSLFGVGHLDNAATGGGVGANLFVPQTDQVITWAT